MTLYIRSRPLRQEASRRLLLILTLLMVVGSGSNVAPLPLQAAPLAQLNTLQWQATGLLNTGRSSFTATLLTDGRVLVAGGAEGDSRAASIASAELYDPATQRWTTTGSLNAARQQQSATLLADGRVLVAGGVLDTFQPGTVITAAEIYDPSTGRWTVTGSLAVARANHFSVLLPNGRVLVGGGYTGSGAVDSTEVYDPATGRWSPGASVPWQAQQMTATPLRDGTILVTGGFDTTDIARAARYDPVNNQWLPVVDMPQGRATHSAEALRDGRVLIVGYWREALLFQPVSGEWVTGGVMSEQRQGPLTALLANGQVIAAGGREGFSGRIFDTAELFDPVSNTWLPGPRLNQSRVDAQMVALPDRSILVIGGQQNGAALRSTERLGPVDGSLPPSCTSVSVIIWENNDCTFFLPFRRVDPTSSAFRLSVQSSNETLLPQAGLVTGGSGTARTLTITPARTDARSAPTRQGDGLVTVTGSDGVTTEQLSIPVTVIPPPWLVMLYLNGDDGEPGSSSSARFESIADAIKTLLLRLGTMTYNPAMRLVVLADLHDTVGDSQVLVRDFGGMTDVTAQLLADRSGWPGFTAELNTADPTTVQSFVRWARGQYGGSTYSFLSLVDHGGGWAPDLDGTPEQPHGARIRQAGGWRGMSIDYSSGGQSMSTKDTGEALQGLDLDVVFFDACLMGMLESAYEIREHADFLIAGQNQLFAAFPYEQYLARDRLMASTLPVSLTTTIVKKYNATEDVQRNPFAIAAIDLRQLRAGSASDLAARVDGLATAILAALPAGTAPIPESHPLLNTLRQAYLRAQKFDYDSSLTIDETRDGYVDLRGFVRLLQADDTVPAAVRAAASGVEAVIRGTSAPVVVDVNNIDEGTYRGVRMQLAQAEGLSIYLPLGERDERPTRVDPDKPGCPAAPERQLGYYANPAQLAFTRDHPAWSALLLRLEENVQVRRAPLPPGCPGLQGATLSEVEVSTLPFRSPAPLPIAGLERLFLPVVKR